MPGIDDAVSRWMADFQRRLDEQSVTHASHAAQAGHSGHPDLVTRVVVLEKETGEHERQAGHSGHADLLARVNRIELASWGAVLGVAMLLIGRFFPGGGH